MLRAVTFATHEEGWFRALKTSCGLHDVPLDVLGWGDTWQGFTHKIRAVRRHVEGLPAEELVLFVDAYDAVVLCAATDIVRRFDALVGGPGQRDGRVVLGIENPHRDPVIGAIKRLPFGLCGSHTLNSGVYMGSAGRLRDFLQRWVDVADAHGDDDDQKALNRLCRLYPEWVAAHVTYDTDGFLVVNACASLPEYLFGDWWPWRTRFPMWNPRIGGRAPAVLHMPGCLDLNPVCAYLGLPLGRRRDLVPLLWRNFAGEAAIGLVVLILLTVVVVVAVTVRSRNRARRG